MSQSLLDRQPDCRRHIANLVVVGGATRQQIADDLTRKYTLHKTPSTRTVTGWLADEGVRDLIRELEGIRRDLAPGESPATLLPEPVDRAEAAMDVWWLMEEHPQYALLAHRVELDPDFDDDDAPRRVLLETESGEELEAASAALVGEWDVHISLGAEPGYQDRVARAVAAA